MNKTAPHRPRALAGAQACDLAGQIAAMRGQLREGVKIVAAPQLFKTPAAQADEMVSLVAELLRPGARILEPNAGTGQLLRALPGVSPFPGPNRQTLLHVEAVEINRDLAEHLRASGLASRVHCADFLECSAEQLGGAFDVVLMNPPFADAIDIRHIEHAHSMLKPGGRLVSLCANGPRQQYTLRTLAEDLCGQWEALPAGSFAEEGTGVNVARVVLPALPAAQRGELQARILNALQPRQYGGRLTAARLGGILGYGLPGHTLGTERAQAELEALELAGLVVRDGRSWKLAPAA